MTVTVFLSVKVADVTTDFLIHVDLISVSSSTRLRVMIVTYQGGMLVPPVTGPAGAEVVSVQAPDQTVGPGMGYVVAVQGAVASVWVEQ
jgi:hypothetical protein